MRAPSGVCWADAGRAKRADRQRIPAAYFMTYSFNPLKPGEDVLPASRWRRMRRATVAANLEKSRAGTLKDERLLGWGGGSGREGVGGGGGGGGAEGGEVGGGGFVCRRGGERGGGGGCGRGAEVEAAGEVKAA